MNAVISGRAGRALLLDRNSLSSFEANDPSHIVPRRQSDVPYLFGEAQDLRLIEDTDIESVARELQADCNFNRALDLTLILLDGELDLNIRKKAMAELDVLLKDGWVRERLENILYAQPLPEDGDLQGALKLGQKTRFTEVSSLLLSFAESQPIIANVSEAWNAIPIEFFGGYDQRRGFHGIAAREGLFRELVATRSSGQSMDAFLESAGGRDSIQLLPNHSRILGRWTALLFREPGFSRIELERNKQEAVSSRGTLPSGAGKAGTAALADSAMLRIRPTENTERSETAARVLIVSSDTNMAEVLQGSLTRQGYIVDSAATVAAAISIFERDSPQVVVCDLQLSEGLNLTRYLTRLNPAVAIIALTVYASVSKTVDLVKAGASVLSKPIELDQLHRQIKDALGRVDREVQPPNIGRITPTIIDLSEPVPRLETAGDDFTIIGDSKPMREVYRKIEAVAKTNLSVLIVGEPGTGKDLMARAIHDCSHRSRSPFIHLNLAAVPIELIEAELFGYSRDSFPFWGQSPGLIQTAAAGSLLLNEIEEIPAALQVKLLHLLQKRTHQKIGSDRTQDADFRLICSTSRLPVALLREGRLLRDLFFYISVIPIELPPLRAREGDIPLLTEHFLRVFREKFSRPIKRVSPAAYQLLLNHSWPGNVRELRDAIERAVVLARTDSIEPLDLPLFIQAGFRKVHEAIAEGISSNLTPEQIEREMIERTLKSTGGNRRDAANLLGIRRPLLHRKIKKYNIDIEGYLSR